MWSYYGSKEGIKRYYPKPTFDTIIEPFAGTAKYSLLYWDRNVILIDKYEVLVRIWKWLQVAVPSDLDAFTETNSAGLQVGRS